MFTLAQGMKKSRPGQMLVVLCREEQRQEMLQILFRSVTTLGVRETLCRCHVLDRTLREFQTPYGRIRRKDSTGYGVCRSQYEYEDLARVVREQNTELQGVKDLVENSIRE